MAHEHGSPLFPDTLLLGLTPTAPLRDADIRANIVEEPHRVGWPRLIPQPSRFNHIRGNKLLEQARIEIIEKILNTLSFGNFVLCIGEYTTRGIDRAHAPLAAVIEASKPKDTGCSWSDAVLQIARAMQDVMDPAGTEQVVSVEIHEAGWPLQAPIEADDAVLDVWESRLAPAVMDVLEQPDIPWQSLGLVRFASAVSLTPGPVTLVVTADDAADARWEAEMLPQIKATMEALRCGVEHVSLWQMQDMHGTEPGQESWKARQNLFPRSWTEEQWILIGDGIAPEGDDNLPGTVGGMVKLQDASGEQTDYILTGHCVIGSDEELTEVLGLERQSLCFADHSSSFTVNVPAGLDTYMLLRSIDLRLMTWRGSLEACKRNPDANFASHEDPEDAAMGTLKMMTDQIARIREPRARIAEYRQLPSGSLKATSAGEYHTEAGKHFALGWALVNIDPERKYLPYTFNRDRPGHNVILEHSFALPDWATAKAQRFAAPGRDVDAVFKLGRMTGWSMGRLNHAPVLKRLELPDDVSCASEGDDGGDPRVQLCHQVLPLFDGTGLLGRFALGGDCGSVVKRQSDGAWIGLIVESHADGWALVAPMDKVLKSIEHITGQIVVEPRPVGAPD